MVSMMSRLLAALCVLVLALVLNSAPASAAAHSQARVPGAVPAVPSEDDSDGASDDDEKRAAKQAAQDRATQIAQESAAVQQDLQALSSVQASARARFAGARKSAAKVAEQLKRDEQAAADARELIGVYMRSIYMSGPNDLTMIASLIDSETPGDLVKRADDARRVGDHKDDQYDEAVALLKRTEESKAAADAAVDAAKTSLDAIADQMDGLLQRRAAQAGDLASQVGAAGTLLDPEQVARNTDAALAWAKYLKQLASWKVPPVTLKQLRKGSVPEGFSVSKKQQGVAVFRKGKERLTVLPERTIAAVTYAVSRLGSAYKWQANSATEMDCSALVDRSWHVPGLKASERDKPRPPVAGGVRGVASRTKLLSVSDRRVGDLVFLSDPTAGVNHVGITVTDSVMVAADPNTGAVNAIPIDFKRSWKAGRLALPEPKKGNNLPSQGKKDFQCGADPDAFISLPDGKVLANPKLCPRAPGVFGEAHMQPVSIRAGRCIAALWPQVQSIGGWRPSDPYPDHPSGHALDVMMPAGCDANPKNVAIGNQIATFLMQNADKFDVKYMMWQHRIWTASGNKPVPLTKWRMVGERGGCTANHMDHVHITLNGNAPAPGVTVVPPTKQDPAAAAAEKRAVERAVKKAAAEKTAAKKSAAKGTSAKAPAPKKTSGSTQSKSD